MKDLPMKQRRNKCGFTLMEVALAVVVVAVGVLGLFALLSTGLDSSAKAVATSQAAFFANATFGALRSTSAEAAQVSTNGWDTFWQSFVSGTSTGTLSVPVPAAWQGYGTAQELKVRGNNTIYALSFVNQPWRTTAVTNIPTGVLRYRITVTNDLMSTRRCRGVTLRVWPGNGPLSGLRDPDAVVFHSEFADVGSL